MNFLNKIDEIHQKERNHYKIPDENKDFSCYIPIESVDHKTTCGFVIKKQEKAKLLLVVGSQRVHLSDLEIVKTILMMGEAEINWLIEKFVLMYLGKSHEITFKINEEVFKGYGIENYSKRKKLWLFSDSEVDINDFIFLINFIFSKDRCWEEMNKIEYFSKRTLCKYISLIDYYSMGNQRSATFLNQIGYPIESKHPVEPRRSKTMFSQIDKFDISLYR